MSKKGQGTLCCFNILMYSSSLFFNSVLKSSIRRSLESMICRQALFWNWSWSFNSSRLSLRKSCSSQGGGWTRFYFWFQGEHGKEGLHGYSRKQCFFSRKVTNGSAVRHVGAPKNRYVYICFTAFWILHISSLKVLAFGIQNIIPLQKLEIPTQQTVQDTLLHLFLGTVGYLKLQTKTPSMALIINLYQHPAAKK